MTVLRSLPARLLPVALCLAALAARGADTPPVDTLKGYGPAPFGTRWEKARTLFPGAEVLPDKKNVGAPSVGGPFVHRLYLTDQRVEGLPKPVNVELRFWKKRLWVVQVYWGDNSEQEVLAMLGKRLGPAQGNSGGGAPLWTTDTAQTTVTPSQRTYGTADLQLSAAAQRWFKQVMKGEWNRPSQAELDEMEERAPAPTPVP
jgi:hypothetical protein